MQWGEKREKSEMSRELKEDPPPHVVVFSHVINKTIIINVSLIKPKEMWFSLFISPPNLSTWWAVVVGLLSEKTICAHSHTQKDGIQIHLSSLNHQSVKTNLCCAD